MYPIYPVIRFGKHYRFPKHCPDPLLPMLKESGSLPFRYMTVKCLAQLPAFVSYSMKRIKSAGINELNDNHNMFFRGVRDGEIVLVTERSNVAAEIRQPAVFSIPPPRRHAFRHPRPERHGSPTYPRRRSFFPHSEAHRSKKHFLNTFAEAPDDGILIFSQFTRNEFQPV